MAVDEPRIKRFRAGLTVIMLASMAVLTWWSLPSTDLRDQPPEVAEFPVPPRAQSPYLNTRPTARYVGAESCADCHAQEYASYLETEHSRALQDVDLAHEPADTEFFHEASGRWYRVYRQDGQMWHRAWIRTEDERELILADYPMHSAIGSGHHSRSYLLQQDGFLLESPVTWYAARNAWGMSPGYDGPVHSEFSRLVDAGCLICHAGRVEPDESSAHQVVIQQAVIGCESCHGPGSLHVDHHQSPTQPTTDAQLSVADLTIVNPSRLERSLQESVCAECHLRGNATVYVRGRQLGDFRPGLPLADIRTDYVLESPEKSMNVVGHMEQMRLSACYRASDDMTCTTCHNPHSRPDEQRRMDYFRDTCLNCHAIDACGLDRAERVRRNPQDNCVACHMPRTSTDIPHLAFTHHRIAIHDAEPDGEQPENLAKLVPLQTRTTPSRVDHDRDLGLASLEWSEKQTDDRAYQQHRSTARRLLESVSQRGLLDAEVDAGLSRLYWESETPAAAQFARSALKFPSMSAAARTNALFVLGDLRFRDRDFTASRDTLRQLVRHRRHAQDWMLLGLCHRQLGQTEQAIEAFQKAVSISPTRVDLREILLETLTAADRGEQTRLQIRALQILSKWHTERRIRNDPTGRTGESR